MDMNDLEVLKELRKQAKKMGVSKPDMVSDQLLDKFKDADTEDRKNQLAERASKKDKKFKRQKFGASFASALAAGLEGEGKRRDKLGLSGAGFAAAFKSGVQPLIDFNAQMNVDAQQKVKQLGFVSISNALQAEKKINEGVSNAVASGPQSPTTEEVNVFDSVKDPYGTSQPKSDQEDQFFLS